MIDWFSFAVGIAAGGMIMAGWTIAMVTLNLRKLEESEREDEEKE